MFESSKSSKRKCAGAEVRKYLSSWFILAAPDKLLVGKSNCAMIYAKDSSY